jgi:hypothetical protein
MSTNKLSRLPSKLFYNSDIKELASVKYVTDFIGRSNSPINYVTFAGNYRHVKQIQQAFNLNNFSSTFWTWSKSIVNKGSLAQRELSCVDIILLEKWELLCRPLRTINYSPGRQNHLLLDSSFSSYPIKVQHFPQGNSVTSTICSCTKVSCKKNSFCHCMNGI